MPSAWAMFGVFHICAIKTAEVSFVLFFFTSRDLSNNREFCDRCLLRSVFHLSILRRHSDSLSRSRYRTIFPFRWIDRLAPYITALSWYRLWNGCNIVCVEHL